MSTLTEIERLLAARDAIRDKFVELGITNSNAKLSVLAAAASQIVNRGAISATVQEGDTYTIPKGFHNGSGTVSGIKGAGSYALQSKSVTPTKNQQNITPDGGYYGLSDVTVDAIPETYQNVSAVDATAADVLAGKVIVTADGTVTAGSMPNHGAVQKTLDTGTPKYTIPKGYHNGAGAVSIQMEARTVTPTKGTQVISPTAGRVIESVTVEPIPSQYITTNDATASAENILSGKTAYIQGEKVTGMMPNRGFIYETMDGLTKTEVPLPTGYIAGGTIYLTGDIEAQLAAI